MLKVKVPEHLKIKGKLFEDKNYSNLQKSLPNFNYNVNLDEFKKIKIVDFMTFMDQDNFVGEELLQNIYNNFDTKNIKPLF